MDLHRTGRFSRCREPFGSRRRSLRTLALSALAAASCLLVAACSSGGGGGGGGPGDLDGDGGDFLFVGSVPESGAVVFLNDPIAFDFSEPVDIQSASAATVSFETSSAAGVPTSTFVPGRFALARRPGDQALGRRLLFVPRLPTNNTYSDGGLRSGTEYRVQLVGGSANNGTALRSTAGRALLRPATVSFSTVDGTLPAQLFRNPRAGGPARTGFEVSTATSLDAVPLGLFGAPPLLIRLSFDQALDPNDANVPVSFDPDPRTRRIEDRGRVYLEFVDADGSNAWIPAYVELERNDFDGATLALQPLGVLPSDAEIRVIVEPDLRDIAGESSVGQPEFDRVFATFRTASAYEQQWNAIVEDFRDTRNIDPGAVFTESLAEVGPGYLRAGFEFDGANTTADYRPLSADVVLNTSFTQVVPEEGLPFSVTGGVFRFRNVTIPQGVTVRGTGPNPMIWQVSGKFTVDGTLSVDGGDGARVDTLRAANTAKAGGVGVCGGGNGGQGTPSGVARDERGEAGRGPGQEAGRGGGGGRLSCDLTCYEIPNSSFYGGSGGGSGGGGGSMATQGDLDWIGLPEDFLEDVLPNVDPTVNTSFQQLFGYGGAGCSGDTGARSSFLAGGTPGDRLFNDARRDNNFWGSGIDLNRRLRIAGELRVPSGGGGGGGGGDTCSPDGQPFFADFSGGGGGGGGGVLIVQALEEIRVSATGRISADGGSGGGGEQAGSCGAAGGGGGGAGGMIVLMSATAIEIEAHGDEGANRYLFGEPENAQFGSRDYSFAISADGGICEVGNFAAQIGETPLPGKYRGNGQPMWSADQYDANPTGGVGGMGLVQLMAPPGETNEDGTNTILDDNIRFYVQGTVVNGLAKQQLLGWRGFANDDGELVDDRGARTQLADGDIRPAPVLLPATIQPRSRSRSRWIDTGRSTRRDVAPDGLPMALDTSSGAVVGPVFEWAGTDANGYVSYESVGDTSLRAAYDNVVDPVAIEMVDVQSSYLGRLAYRVELVEPVLGTADRFVHYEAEFLNAANVPLQGHAILAHDEQSMWLDPSRGPVPAQATGVRVRAKFFEVQTRGVESLGETYLVETQTAAGPIQRRFPVANVRIGFAFHRDIDPEDELAGRYPADSLNDFVYDLQDPGLQAWLQTGPPRYVMWDVLFDLEYRSPGAQPQGIRANRALPELRFLRIPFRF